MKKLRKIILDDLSHTFIIIDAGLTGNVELMKRVYIGKQINYNDNNKSINLSDAFPL